MEHDFNSWFYPFPPKRTNRGLFDAIGVGLNYLTRVASDEKLLRDQFKITSKDKAALLDVCLFIVTSYVKPWLQCILALKAHYQDMCFLKLMKAYGKIDKSIAKAALQKISRHLWYLTDEASILSLFDDDVDQLTKLLEAESIPDATIQVHFKPVGSTSIEFKEESSSGILIRLNNSEI
ncbi:hypothetical protein J437_LFUL017307, partial [Ladona fulva]